MKLKTISTAMPKRTKIFHHILIPSLKSSRHYTTKSIPPPDPQGNKPGMPEQPPKPPQDPKKVILVLRTWWSRMTWKEQNQIYSRCLKQVPIADGKTRTELDMIAYRDMKLKICLKKWDLKDENKQDVQITENIIDQLVPEVAQELLNNFEMVTEASEEDLKN